MRPTRRQSYDQALAALRAEIRAGELLREMEKNKGARATGNNQQKKVRSSPATAPDNYGTQSRAAARPQPEAFQVIVMQLIGLLPKEVQGSDRFRIKQVLETLAARQTVRGAYMSNLRRLLGDEKAKQFDALYRRRSKFLHEGNGRGTFDAPAAAALEIGLELLLPTSISRARLNFGQASTLSSHEIGLAVLLMAPDDGEHLTRGAEY